MHSSAPPCAGDPKAPDDLQPCTDCQWSLYMVVSNTVGNPKYTTTCYNPYSVDAQ